MPIVSGLEREYKGRLVVKRINIHAPDTRPIREKYGFTATPEFFLVNPEGAVLAHWDGDVKLADFRPTLDKYFAAAANP
jgi:hypothetical protein